jgi:hypothetical protein
LFGSLIAMLFRRLLLCLVAWGLQFPFLAAAPVISEFLASNSAGLQDGDGDFSDWLEIYNPDTVSVNLDGWHLTDNANNLAKWRFPAVVIPAGGYLVVFASNKNRQVVGQPLHTNFALSADGEYLALVAADGLTVVSAFSPKFPAQAQDISYGVPSNVTETTVIASNALCRWLVPTSTTPATAWRGLAFVDTAWAQTTMGVGYDTNTTNTNYIPEIGPNGNTQLLMSGTGKNPTCYVRVPFTVADPGSLVSLKIRIKYDDGFIAYLNGQPLQSGGVALSRNAPASPVWNSAGTADHSDAASIVFETFDVSSSLGGLLTGQNVLAFQALNKSNTSSDFLFKIELVADAVISGTPSTPGYFATATPGARNGGPDSLVVPQQVVFSRAEGAFITNFNLTLGGAAAGQSIRYTTNGTVPAISSTLYSTAIPVSASTLVRARIFDNATGAAGFTGGANYEKLDTTLASYAATAAPFRSSLPVMVLNNRGIGEIPNDDIYRDVRIHVFDRDGTGYSNISAAPVLNTAAGAKIRGSSSSGFDKKSYSVEFRNELLDSRSLEILGLPAGSDWSLLSCDDFDPSYMRNAWVYEAARRTGRWSPRTRFVELFFNQDGDNLEYADYRGIYVLCETVRDQSTRADITSLETSDLLQPAVSGGYIFKVDRQDSDEFAWRTTRALPPINTGGAGLVIHRPKLPVLATQQRDYLVTCFQSFEDALFTDAANSFTTRNYRNHIEPVSWVDHNLFSGFAKNVDALRLSAYFLKDRGRRIEGGPLWDFDRSANSTDWRDDDPLTWVGTGDSTNYFTYAWWNQLFMDIEFRQLYVDRWQALRAGTLSTAQIHSILDGFLTEFKISDADNPSTREYAKWYGSATAKNLQSEVTALKNWLASRASWIDGQFTPPPVVARPPGIVSSGQTTTLTIPSGTTVCYRLDGLDPRAEGGGVRPGTLTYSGTPVSLTSTRVLNARAWRSGSFTTPATNWSGLVNPLYLVNETYASAADLRVSVIQYNPLGPDASEIAALPDVAASDFEWIELANNGSGSINLEGVRMVSGSPVSALTLPPFTLAPGQRCLMVKRRAAFLLRYPSAASRIVAEWTGDRSISNNGESILIHDRFGATLADFGFKDSNPWPSRADGDGPALEYLGATNSTADYNNPSNWRSSAEVNGSPGFAGTGPRNRIVINEVLASSVLPQVDAIELLNPGSGPLNIGGWFLGNCPGALTGTDYKQFRIPNGTIIPAGGHLVFTETAFNPNGQWNPAPGSAGEWEFSLDGYRGGEVWLVSADPVSGKLDAFEDHVEFTPALPGISQGRWPNGTSGFMSLASRTLFDENSASVPRPGAGAANSTPLLGAIQVTEIMYHPLTGATEYVEVVNTQAASQTLDQWNLRGDVEFNYGPTVTLAAGESVLMVPFDPVLSPATATAFRAEYQVPAATRLIGPWSSGLLEDAAGTVRLRRKIPPPPEEPLLVGLMLEDEVPYSASLPWPVGASGTGLAIQRLGTQRRGNDPTAWLAAAPSAGTDAGGILGWQREYFPTGGPLSGATDDHDSDGIANRLEYLLGTDPHAADAPPWSCFPVDATVGQDLVLEYRLRRDRTDFPLIPMSSADLLHWQPAADDRHHAFDDLYEIRRTHLPIGPASGYLRLVSPVTP